MVSWWRPGIGWMVLFFAGTSDNPGQVGILAEREANHRDFILNNLLWHQCTDWWNFQVFFAKTIWGKAQGSRIFADGSKDPKGTLGRGENIAKSSQNLLFSVFRQINPNYVVINDPHWQLVLEDNMWIMIHSTDGSSCSSTNRRPSWDASRPMRELAADTRMEDACSASQMSPGSLASTKD